MAGALSRLATRVRSWLGGAEASWRGPFYGQGYLGHYFQLGRLEDGWQRDLKLDRYGLDTVPVIAGLRQLHRSAFAQLRPHHMREEDNGKIIDLKNSAPLRVLLKPNDYETGADFASRVGDIWLTRGEVVIWARRNARSEVDELHIIPPGAYRLTIEPESASVFYGIAKGGAVLADLSAVELAIPARDILHLRWATPRHPLIGESGFAAAGLAAGINVALSASQAAFFAQMRRPSGILSSEQPLNGDQIQALRAAYDEQSKGMAAGGVPILSQVKWQPMGISSEDAEVIAALRMSNEDIARCVGVPPPLVGDLQNGGLTNTEALIEFWLSVSLGGLIERFECGLNVLLGLDGRSQWIDLSTEALLRVNLQARMDAYSKGIMGGVLAPNEARSREGLSPVPGGDEVFLQRQNTPVNLLGELAAADLTKASTPPAAPPPGDTGADPASDPAIDPTGLELALGTVRNAWLEQRALVAEQLLAIERVKATLTPGRDGAPGRDGVDGVSITGVAQASDGTCEFEFSNGERFEVQLPRGAPGEPGASGERGADGLGVTAAPYVPGVHRAGAVVEAFEGRIYRAVHDTAQAPGDSADWQRVGQLGLRWRGPFDKATQYEAGDLYVNGGTFLVLASGEHRCLAPKPLPPSEVRAICGGELEGRLAPLERAQAALGLEVQRTREAALDLIEPVAKNVERITQALEHLGAHLAELRRDVNQLQDGAA